jgi:hypothetical protein
LGLSILGHATAGAKELQRGLAEQPENAYAWECVALVAEQAHIRRGAARDDRAWGVVERLYDVGRRLASVNGKHPPLARTERLVTSYQ